MFGRRGCVIRRTRRDSTGSIDVAGAGCLVVLINQDTKWRHYFIPRLTFLEGRTREEQGGVTSSGGAWVALGQRFQLVTQGFLRENDGDGRQSSGNEENISPV